jgi:hypothetical protein
MLMRSTQPLPTAMGASVLTSVLASVLTLMFTACGAGSSAQPIPLRTNEFDRAVAQVQAAGRPAYYLGWKVDDLPLTVVDLVEENAPAFQVEVDYGTCESPGDGGCSAPVVVSTNDWRPDVAGTTCRRLDQQLGVPAGVLMGELTLVTGDLVVTVSDFRGRDARDDVDPAVRLLSQLRSLGATQPADTLPPPDSAVAAWMDEVCGSTPGREVSHPFEDEQNPLDNSASNTGVEVGLGGCVIAFVDGSGAVMHFAATSTPDAQLSEWARALG